MLSPGVEKFDGEEELMVAVTVVIWFAGIVRMVLFALAPSVDVTDALFATEPLSILAWVTEWVLVVVRNSAGAKGPIFVVVFSNMSVTATLVRGEVPMLVTVMV